MAKPIFATKRDLETAKKEMRKFVKESIAALKPKKAKLAKGVKRRAKVKKGD